MKKEDFLTGVEEFTIPMDYEYIARLSVDRNSEIRIRCAEVMALYPTLESEEILLKMLVDKESLVRVNACDSLYFSSSLETLSLLCDLMGDDDYLIRGYAMLSSCDISMNINDGVVKKKTANEIRNYLQTEEDTWVKACGCLTMTILGEREYFKEYINYIHDEDYHITTLVMNGVEEIIDYKVDVDYNFIKSEVEECLKECDIDWMKKQAEDLIKQIDTYMNEVNRHE